MMIRILKKDMKRRKSVNVILFLFMFLASVFLASSINNILVVSSAVDYYMDYANIPDVNLVTFSISEKGKISAWLDQEAPDVEDYDYNTLISILDKDISITDPSGNTMYLGTTDASYCKVFDENGDPFTLNPGQIALPRSLTEHNNLKTGDSVRVKAGDTERTFSLACIAKDAAFGSDMVGMKRLIINPEDYREISGDEKAEIFGLYYVNTSDEEAFTKEMNRQGFQTLASTVTIDTYKMIYMFDMILAGLLVTTGICLILIALLVLRFTLVFTLEEDYREIGIMKAIGIRNFGIQKIYLLKYLFLVVSGAVLGMAASIPIGQAMISSVSKNMIMEKSSANLWVNIFSTALIITFVMLFCYFCTRRLRKISAIAAIRGGNTGKRYKRRAGIRLYQRSMLPVPCFLGMNDMFSNVKRYIMLMITFSISFILITIPLNTLNTMRSDEMALKFSLDPESAVFISRIELDGDERYSNSTDLTEGMERVERELAEQGYNATLTGVSIYFLWFEEAEENEKQNIMVTQFLGAGKNCLTYQEGTAPELENEIAFSKNLMEKNHWEIGDYVDAKIGGQNKRMIITGKFSDYMQIGSSARMNPEIDLQGETMFDYWCIQVDMETDKTQKELAEELNQKLPEYEWVEAQEIVDKNVGGLQESLEDLMLPMTGILCGVIMLITFLMERLFIAREKGEIAMMKSIGFKHSTIRLWQVIRILCAALVSMVAAIPLSLLSNHFVLKPVFAIMGAELDIQVVPWMVYGLYPGILIAGITAATVMAAWNIKKIHIHEMNNME